MLLRRTLALFLVAVFAGAAVAEEKLNQPPKGFKALFNGKDLANWKGLVASPPKRAAMTKEELAAAQKIADQEMRDHWSVEDGVLVFDGKGKSLCTAKDYGDFELLVDFKILEKGDSGIYLRGTPQVQIWDPKLRDIGSGGLFNNQKNPSGPLVMADNPVGEWNTFRIRMVGPEVSVWLNSKLVVDDTVLENYWERDKPIYPTGQIELQNHGNTLYFRNVFIKELVSAEGVTKIHKAAPTKARVKPAEPRKVLVYTNAAGFVHSSIPYGAHAVQNMGRQTGAFEADISNDPAAFLPENLEKYDAVVLVNTTGDWFLPHKNELAKLDEKTVGELKVRSERLRNSLLNFIAGGGGLVGFHAASDSHYSWPEFGELIGGYFNRHPWHQKVTVKLDEPQHALLAAFEGSSFEVADEIYQFKDPYSREKLRVLLSIDNSSIDASKGQREDKDYAVAWIHPQGKGRVFYSSLGHREEIYWNPAVMKFYLDGIQYALGDLDVDDAPSVQSH